MNRQKIPPLRIVLSGGGIRGTAHTGALQKLESYGMLKTVREYIGVSAGGLLAFSLCIGYTVETLLKFSKEFDFSLIRSLEPETMLSFFETFGLDTGERLQRLCESLLRQKKLSATLTFEELRAACPQAPRLRIFATDLYTCSPVEFSENATPHISIVTALRASVAIPGYFVPVPHPDTGHALVDGAILHNLATAFLTEEEKKATLTLAFSIDHHTVTSLATPFQFFEQLYACFHVPRTKRVVQENAERIILIPCGEYPMWDFEASTETRERLIQAGRDAVEAYMVMPLGQKPKRRYSCA